jgi:hypothetical protein
LYFQPRHFLWLSFAAMPFAFQEHQHVWPTLSEAFEQFRGGKLVV